MKLGKLALAGIALSLAGGMNVEYAYSAESENDRATHVAADRVTDRARHRHGKLRLKVYRIFNALDTDGSDTITLDEWLSNITQKAEKQFDRIDTDDDQLISLEEFLAVGSDRGDDIDRDAVRACVADALGQDVPERPDRETRFDEIDTNDDGYIDFDEFLDVKTDKATDRFHHIDADGDGAITKQELAQALKQHRERRGIVRECVADQRETSQLMEGDDV